jgi:nitrogen regulatory protein P-II 1
LIIWHYLCFLRQGDCGRINKVRKSCQTGVGSLLFSGSTKSQAMKKIEAIFKPFKLDEVRDALTVLGINDSTFSEVEGCGRRHGLAELYRDRKYTPDFSPKIKLELVVVDALSDAVSAAIVEASKTGSLGDGHILISQVEEAVLIRPEETDAWAVC